MKVYHGNILTCNSKDEVFSYLVEDKGKIVYVGNDLPIEYNHEIIELNNQALCPSFVDTHMHFASYATFSAGLNVMDAKSNREMLEMMKEFVKTCKDSLIIGFGASPYSVEEKCLITRQQLDEVCSDRPIFLIKYDGHTCIINTYLLNKIKNKIKDKRGYHEESGEMNQDAFFEVSNYVTNSISIPKLIKNMQDAIDDLATVGIGMIHSVSGVGFNFDLDVDLENWFSKGLNNDFQMRVYMQTMNVKKALRRKLKRIGGCFECALDGCFGSVDAALHKPYENTDNYGILYYSDDEVINFCKEANRKGLQIELHAIGDKAMDQAVKAISLALEDTPRENHRHTIIHACLPTKNAIKYCQIYNIQLAVQPSFINWKQEPNEYLESILNKRINELNPLKTYMDKKILLSAGSDAPCTKPNPIEWMHKACNNNQESLTIKQALKMCTYNGYYTSFDEKERGSLEVGKYADMVLLSKNPYETNLKELNTIQVKQLYLKGKKYTSCKQNPIKHIIKAIG